MAHTETQILFTFAQNPNFISFLIVDVWLLLLLLLYFFSSCVFYFIRCRDGGWIEARSFFSFCVIFFLFSVHTELICIYECKTVYRFAFICRWRIAIRNWKANREYQCIVFAVKRDMWSPCFVVDVCRRFFSDIVISLLNCLCLFFLVVNCFFLLPNLSMYLYILHTWIFSVRPYVCHSIYDLDVRSFSHVVCIDF